jgi:RNA polymerase sigma-70 factor (ECF subfamily)
VAEQVRSPEQDPEQRAYGQELAHEIEGAVATLPDVFRGVFMLREVEGLSTLETAECLGLNEETVKTRLHRARAHLRRALTARIGESASTAFQFHAPRCDRVVRSVFARLKELGAADPITRRN